MRECFYFRYFPVIMMTWIFMYNEALGLNSLAFNSAQDSIKQKYRSIDTLNPDCPCYKYQKKAEREYKQILRNETRTNKVIKQVRHENYLQSGVSPISRRKKSFYFKIKSLHKTTSFNFSRHREKKIFFNFFKRNIASCTF